MGKGQQGGRGAGAHRFTADKEPLHTLSTVETWSNEGGDQLYGFARWPLWCMRFPCISESLVAGLASDSCLHRQITWPNRFWRGRGGRIDRPPPSFFRGRRIQGAAFRCRKILSRERRARGVCPDVDCSRGTGRGLLGDSVCLLIE